MSNSFDRIKPPERRLLEREESRNPDSRTADKQGRAALFSASEEPTTPGAGVPPVKRASKRTTPRPDVAAPTAPVGGQRVRADGAPVDASDPRLPQGRSPVHVECGHCGVTCPMPLADAAKRAIPLVVVAPWKSHPVFATCPCGERRAWLKPRLGR